MFYACHVICTLSSLDAARTMRFAKNTQHDTSEVLPLPRKMTLEVTKVLCLPQKHATQKRYFGHFGRHVRMSEVPCLPRKTTFQPVWKPSTRRGFAASPIDTATQQENQSIETRRDMLEPQNEHFVRDFLLFSLCSQKIDVFLRVFL